MIVAEMAMPRISEETRASKASDRAAGFDFYLVPNLTVTAWRVYRNSRHLGVVRREANGFVAMRRRTLAEGGASDESAPFVNRRKAAEWLAGFRV